MVQGHRVLIEDNYVHDVAFNAIHIVGGSSRALVQRNYIDKTGMGGIFFGFYTGAAVA